MNQLKSTHLMWLMICFYLMVANAAMSAQTNQDFALSDWKLSDTGVEIVQIEGAPAFKVSSGKLTSIGELFRTGIIEYEMKIEGKRSFAYTYFRENGEESEAIYFRTHKSEAPDAVQYSPEFQNRSAWQLYHGNKGTARAYLPANEWLKVKILVSNNDFSVWLGDKPTQIVENMTLRGKDHSGSVSLRGFIPRGSKASYSAIYRNIRVSPTKLSAEPNQEISELSDDILTKIKVSSVFEASKSPLPQFPKHLVGEEWSVVNAESDGVFEFLRWRKIPQGMRSYAVVAETILRSDKALVCQFNFGYSDALSTILNGQIVSHVDASYRYSQNRQEGVLHDQQQSLFLPLKAGDNTLHMIIADSFGGWGLKVTKVDCPTVSFKAN